MFFFLLKDSERYKKEFADKVIFGLFLYTDALKALTRNIIMLKLYIKSPRIFKRAKKVWK